MSKDMKIVFMGTPEFAVPSLQALFDAGYLISAVVTQPDRPRGRGHRLAPSPVKERAQELGLPVVQFARIGSPEGVEWLRAEKPDLLITAAFGQILTEEILAIPPLGCINVHASLLPKYRGASPIVWSIINGEKETGVTTMYTVKALDAGAILESDTIEIGPDATGGTLSKDLSELGAKTLLRTLRKLEDGALEPKEQREEEATYYAQLAKDFPRIDWDHDAAAVLRFIRALAPEPGAYGVLPGGERVHVYEASLSDMEPSGSPGDILAADSESGLLVRARDAVISLDTIKRANSRMMPAKDSLRGRKIEAARMESEQ